MEWQDEGLILGSRKHGETSAIVEMMTQNHGRHLGLVRGGRSARMRPVLQPGNSATIVWRARLEDHLGMFAIEPGKLRAAELMASPSGIYGVQMLACHLRLLPERDPHPGLYEAASVLLDNFSFPEIAASLMVRFELALLDELGFGLDLKSCAATGQTNDLVFVSPKSGRAVSADAGKPWSDRMLVLPDFLRGTRKDTSSMPSVTSIEDGFRLTGFFLERHIYGARGIRHPDERLGFIKNLVKQEKSNG
ncbi:MAG: DNA repair protein RecO [Rhizobiaceae bacterium]|jgi:DNA repair protein RecO (recombination protein O)|nr:DNA repair protein RecO [Rhizobiaceae bacterium]